MYACMYEHPQICMPRKEINFFSRERNWSRGFDWYEGIFAECPATAVAGEFSTSYLPDPESSGADPRSLPGCAPDRLSPAPGGAGLLELPQRHSRRGGVAEAELPGRAQSHPEYIEGGRYGHHLSNYLELFPRDQILVSMFDDARREPLAAIQEIYRFLDVDPEFRPTMLDRPVGIGRIPRSQGAERSLLEISAAFRHRRPLRPVWWMAKRIGNRRPLASA